jgi:hypothetical protein
MKSSGVRFLSCSAFRGSDRFTVTVSIRQRHESFGFNTHDLEADGSP